MVVKWLIQYQRRIFGFSIFMCFCLVAFQYRFNYFSTTYCTINDLSSSILKDENTLKILHKRLFEQVESSLHTTTTIPTSVRTSPSPQATCSPERYVLFLKTHKTGSSTITNILNRFADKNNMSVLLPKGSIYYSFDWPNKFRLSFSVDTFTRPHFLANHARYSRKSMNVLFPRESTKYISVLRHPVSQWESTFQYMSFPYILDISHKEDPLNFFLSNLPTAENIKEIAIRYPSLYLIRNPLFFDLGLDHKDYDNATFIRRALKTLDDDFDVVLIMEHFDESLTLLRRRLCWDIDDVVYFKMNERLNKHKRRVLTEIQIDKIKSWNNADMVLYNHFVEKFWKEVKNEGPGFYDDVNELRKRREYYTNICIEREAIEEAYSSVFVKGYKMRTNLTGDMKLFCERMLKNEIHFMDYFRDKRKRMINSLEGVNIENFENSHEELEIFVDTPTEIKISDYRYGRPKPTKKMVQNTRRTTANRTINTYTNLSNLGKPNTKLKSKLKSKIRKKNKNSKSSQHYIDELQTKSAVKPDVKEIDYLMENQPSDIELSVEESRKSAENNDSQQDLVASSVTVENEQSDELKYDGKTIMKALQT